jgi:tol-pal system protein YbgF
VGEEPPRRVHDQAVTITRASALIPILLGATACIMPDQLADYQKQVADVQRSLEAVRKSQSELSQQVAELKADSGTGETVKRSDIADMSTRLDQVVRQSTATSDRVDQIGARVDRLSQEVQSAKDAVRRGTPAAVAGGEAPPVAPGGGPPASGASTAPGAAPLAGSVPSPSALYASAYADFSKGNYALAIQGFEEYARTYPETELADNAMYWIGECYFSQGSYTSAVNAFDAMLEKYPGSDKAAAANLKKALAFVQQNQIGQGIEQLRFVTATYPGTDEARIASDRLSALGKP